MTLFFVSRDPYEVFGRERFAGPVAGTHRELVDGTRHGASGNDLELRRETLHRRIEAAIRAGHIWEALKFEFQLDLDLLLGSVLDEHAHLLARPDPGSSPPHA